MSRAYRITVKESETREIRGSDEISTQLDLLEILPPEAMAGLLKAELQGRGFEEQPDGRMVRTDGPLTLTIDPCNGEVSVKSELAEAVAIEVKENVTGFDDVGPNQDSAREKVRARLKEQLDKKADDENARLQGQATDALEKHLDNLQPELAKVVNKVTRDALKEKARQLGSVKEIAEDADTGEMTIKVEV